MKERKINPGILCFLPILLVGCHNRESLVPGTWADNKGQSIELRPDKTFSAPFFGKVTANGTWTLDGNDLVMTTTTIGTKPIAEIKKRMLAVAARGGSGAQKMAADLDKPNILKLSDDGKSMSTDKAKDTNSGPSVTLTKKDSPSS